MFKKLFIHKTHNSVVQLFRSVISGMSSTFIDVISLALFVFFFKFNVSVATALAFIIGISVNYILNSFWVFSADNLNSRIKEITEFIFVSAIGLLLNMLIINIFDRYLSKFKIFGNLIPPDKYYLVGKVLVAMIVFLWNFFARKYIIYNENFLNKVRKNTEKQEDEFNNIDEDIN